MFIAAKTRTALAVAAASLSLAALAAPAMAADNAPSLPANGCLVEIDGHIHTVPAGTVIMGLRCGTDGDWHLAKAVSTGTNPKPPVLAVEPAAMAAYGVAP